MGMSYICHKALTTVLVLLALCALLLAACGEESKSTSSSSSSASGTTTTSSFSSGNGSKASAQQPLGTAVGTSVTRSHVVVRLIEKKGSKGDAYTFEPANITIKVGTVVEWLNASDENQILSSTTAGLFSSDSKLARNGSYQKMFNQPGVYMYFSKEHPSARGTITVTH
jgi:plastocyanin